MGEFSAVYHHRLKYFLSPQFDLYRNIKKHYWERTSNVGPKRVLDYGCGNGIGSLLLVHPEHVVTGIDKDPEVVGLAKDLFGHLVDFRVEDWGDEHPEKVPPDEEKFDLITCVEVIEHVEFAERLLCNLYMFLAPGGTAYVSTQNQKGSYRKNSSHVGRFTRESFEEIANEYFAGASYTDFTLQEEIPHGSNVTPMVLSWTKPLNG